MAQSQPASPDVDPKMDKGSALPQGRIALSEDIEIYSHLPIEELSIPEAKVYSAKDRRATGEQIAVLCGHKTLPRLTGISSYRNLKNQTLLRLLDAGIVDWTPENKQLFAFIFEKPAPKKLMTALDSKPYKFSEDRIIPTLIQPVLHAFQSLQNIDFVHGAIHPMNIFISGLEGAETVILGECLSAPPFSLQHVLFEPVDRAMAQPMGRGSGSIQDDLYAFGWCVAMVLRGENPFTNYTTEQIIHKKLDEGSYAMAVGGGRLPNGISEFLRGVLSDDDMQRWTLDEALKWLEGRRLNPKTPRPGLTAARPFTFKDKKYWDLRALSYSFSQNLIAASKAIEQSSFDLWMKRNFEDKDLTKRLDDVASRGRSSGTEKYVADLCMALDPYAPIRYKSLSVFPNGFGTALSHAVMHNQDLQEYGEMLIQQIFSTWINQRFEEILDAGGQLTQFEKCRNSLTQKLAGYGIERVIYILNKESICLSPLLRDYFVLSPGRLVMSLEDLVRKGQRPSQILDRHMIAFLSVREPKTIDPWLGYITSKDRAYQMIGFLRTFSRIQAKFNLGPLPYIAGWMCDLLPPVIEIFKDLDLRQELSKKLDRMREKGDLYQILILFDDNDKAQEDEQRFKIAKLQYAVLEREKESIKKRLKKNSLFGQATGRQISMIISALLSTIVICAYIFYFVARRVS